MAAIKLSYVICTAPRTGSSLLCAALWRTGIAGRPAEYFDIHAHNEEHWQKHFAIRDNREYLGKVVDAGTTDNGVFGFKLHWHQSPALMAKLRADRRLPASSDVPDDAATGGAATITATPVLMDRSLRSRLGEVRYIWLRRENKVAQAISYYRAGKTDLWRLPASSALQSVVAPSGEAKPVAFDYAAIHKLVQDVQRFDRAWYDFYMRGRLRALIVVYEDFIRTYEATVHGVLDYLGVDNPAVKIVAPQYLRQADAISAEWERRYRERQSQPPAPPRYTPSRKRRPSASAERKAAQGPSVGATDAPKLIAYDLGANIDMAIEPAPPSRAWMDAVPKRFVYRCLPLVIANQAGWLIRNSHRLTVTWDGSPGLEGIRVVFDQRPKTIYALSHFGSGILTFNVGCLFRTPPGYNLHVRGPANWPKDGICALEGIVETDWSRATFTMNWKLTRPNHPVTFEPGEPIAMVAPVPRGDIERFRPEQQPIAADPEWEAGYREWSLSRSAFNAALRARQPEAVAAGWQRHYVLGMTIEETDAPDHQTALSLLPFADRRPAKA